MRQEMAKNQWNCIVMNLNQIKASFFQHKFKSIFPTKSCNGLLHSTTNHSISFHLCPIGITLTYLVQYYPYYPVVTFLANR